MKWAEAKTRLSFVTATLNCLWVDTPAPLEQHHIDARAGQVRRGAGVQRVGVIPQLAVERGERSEEHTSELQSQSNLVCRLLLEKKKSSVYDYACPTLLLTT